MTVITAVKMMILARMLSQYDFGLFALVMVAVGIVESMTETGVNPTIIQSSKSVSYFTNTAWVISIVRGLIISIVMIIMGFGMRLFYDSPQLFILVGITSLIPLIKGFINPFIVTLQKDMLFYRDSLYRLSLLIVEAAATILLAFLMRSVYALIFGLIIAAAFEVILTFVMFKERPRFIYMKSRAQEIFENMRGLNALAILGYIVENVDSIVIGKVTSTSALGVYQNSYGLTHRLNLQLAKSVAHGTFPVYARIQRDQDRLRRALFRTLSISILGFTLMGLPFFLFPEFTIRFFLGENWLEAVPLVRPLILAGLVQSVVSICSAFFVVRKSFRWLNINLLSTVTLMLILIPWMSAQSGLVGAVLAVLLARIMSVPFILIGMHQTLRHIPKYIQYT